MHFHTIALMRALAVHLPGLCAATPLPRDMQAFIDNAQACEHFGTEYDPEASAERRRQVEHGIRKYCGAASRQLPKLRAKYRRDPATLEMIDRSANEAVTDYRR